MKIDISPRIIQQVASSYTEINRIFMEFVDNSIDSAEDFFNEDTNSYSKEINITVDFDKKEMCFTDNCSGMTDIAKVVSTIGNSDKRNTFVTNGQFGFGIHSFMAACEMIEITTKTIDNDLAKSISFKRADFDKDKLTDTNIPDPKNKKVNWDSGTHVKLSSFDKSKLKLIDVEQVKGEIEAHFESLLKRGNLNVVMNGAKCEPYDYNQSECLESYEDDVENLTLDYYRGKVQNGLIKYDLKRDYTPINICLKVTKNQISKPPFLIIKGRRINTLNHLQSFKSKGKSGVWSHQHLTGYIDVHGFLEPTIQRTDVKSNDKSKALFSYLEKIESLIEDCLKVVNKKSEGEHYRNVENELNKALAKLAKLENMRLRTENLTGNDNNVHEGEVGQGGKKNDDPIPSIPGESGPVPPIDSPNPEDNPGGVSEETGDKNIPSNIDAEFEDTGFTGGARKKHGLNVMLVEGAPVDEVNDKVISSQLDGGDLRIFLDHPEFQKRQSYTQGGEAKKQPKVTQRLISYLAGEITIHFEDQVVAKRNSGNPEYGIRLFKDLTERRNDFEELIQHMENQNFKEFME